MSLAEELEKLRELHRSGAITDDEYARAKAKLLDEQETPAFHGSVSTGGGIDAAGRSWTVFIHLAQFAGFVLPGLGFLLPIVLWQMKKDVLPGVDAHGKAVTNWVISELIYLVVTIIASFLIIGIPFLIAVLIAGIVFPIIGAIKANEGELWRYPLTIEFVK